MARILDLNNTGEAITKSLARLFQSGHVNFLIGSGASLPAISAAGEIEQEIADLFAAGQDDQAREKMYGFLATIQGPMNDLIVGTQNDNNAHTLSHYRACLQIIETILTERRTKLLPKQATIFTTNYDLFIEQASVAQPALKLNDGFSRIPSLTNQTVYSPRNFFTSIYNTGNLYNYTVEIPSINLIKLHGSLSWTKDGDDILFNVAERDFLGDQKTPEEVEHFIRQYAVVLPQTAKYRTTLMERTYYELLRIYANQLDRENTLLMAFGFSFDDAHIRDITIRALKNPTLKLVAFAYDDAARHSFAEKFGGYDNVDIIAPAENAVIDFHTFNEAMRSFLPTEKESK